MDNADLGGASLSSLYDEAAAAALWAYTYRPSPVWAHALKRESNLPGGGYRHGVLRTVS